MMLKCDIRGDARMGLLKRFPLTLEMQRNPA